MCEQAAEAGDDTTDNAREICGYLFAEEIPDDDTPVSRAVGRALRAGEVGGSPEARVAHITNSFAGALERLAR